MKKGFTSIVLFLLCLYGCVSVGPDYRKPDLAVPAQWSETQENQVPTQALEQIAWWKSFNDPVLDDLILQAVRSNLDLKQAQARVIQARGQIDTAVSSVLPQVNGSGSFTRSKASKTASPDGSGTASSVLSTLYQAGFDSSWEIDLFGGKRRGIESAQANLEAGIENVHAVRLTLLGEVAKYYIDLRAYQQQLLINRRTADSQRSTVELTRKRYETGLTSYLDVAQAEAQLAITESNIPSIETSVKQTIHHLGILIGKDPNTLKPLLTKEQPVPSAPEGLITTGIPSDLLQRRPDLRKSERELAAVSADIGVAVSDLYPKINITAALGLQSGTSANLLLGKSRYWSFVPGVTLPLFEGGRIRGNIKIKKALFEEALFRYQDSLNKALEDVENTLTALYAEKRRNQSLLEAVQSGKQTVELATTRYKRGLTAFLDVLIAEQSLYATQLSLSQSNAVLVTNLIALYKGLGGGWQATVSSIDMENK